MGITFEEFKEKCQRCWDWEATCKVFIEQCDKGKITLQQLENELIREINHYYYNQEPELGWCIDAVREKLQDPDLSLMSGSNSLYEFFSADEDSLRCAFGYEGERELDDDMLN